jgi:DNA-binding MarR family transcriptional regulator
VSRVVIPDGELAARFQSALLHLLRRLAQEDRAGGVSPSRLSALSVLVLRGPQTIGALATAEGVRPPTMTRLAAGMVADGLIERILDPSDRRLVRVAATETGRSLLFAGRDRRIAVLTAMVAPLTPKERRRLVTAAEIVEKMLAGPP